MPTNIFWLNMISKVMSNGFQVSQTDSAETYRQETAMSEPVDIVAEGRAVADILLRNGNMRSNLAVLALLDEVERLREQLEMANDRLVDQVFQPKLLSSDMLKALDAMGDKLDLAYRAFYNMLPSAPYMEDDRDTK